MQALIETVFLFSVQYARHVSGQLVLSIIGSWKEAHRQGFFWEVGVGVQFANHEKVYLSHDVGSSGPIYLLFAYITGCGFFFRLSNLIMATGLIIQIIKIEKDKT